MENEAAEEAERQSYLARRILGAGMIMLGCGAVGGAVGAAYGAFTPTTIELGPNQATARLTLDNMSTIDLGYPGSFDKPTGWLVGLNISVKGIQAPVGKSPIDGLSNDVAEYGQMIADPNHIKENAIHTFLNRVWHDGLEGGGIIAGLGTAPAYMLRERRKRRRHANEAAAETIEGLDIDEAARTRLRAAITSPKNVHPKGRRLVIAGTTVILATSGCTEYLKGTSIDNQAADPALAETFMHGYATHGQMLQAGVDVGLPMVLAFEKSVQTFYNDVKDNFNKQFDAQFADDPLDHDNYDYVLSVSDDHCNVGNYRVEAAIANKFRVKLVINSGDWTNSGFAAEAECVSAQADDLKARGRTEVFAGGNHDSPTTEAQAKKHGVVILHMNKAVTIDGIRILGEDDVNESVFGTPMRLRGKETVEDETDLLTKAACKAKPDILVVHEPEMATPAVQEGCTSLSISGHLHALHPPVLLNKQTGSYQFIEGTSGGAKEGSITFGTLKQDAITTVFKFDKTTHRAVGFWVMTEHPDKRVDISPFQPMEALPDGQVLAGGPPK